LATPIRRIVTGHAASGRSTIVLDGPAPDVQPGVVSPLVSSTLIWRTDRGPASNEGNADMAPAGLRVPTAPQQRGGTVFRITEIPPDSALGDVSRLDMSRHGAHTTEEGRKRHFMFHTTETVDYAIVLEGEIWAMLDDAETLMRQGDVLVQRGTHHSWSNRSDKMCRLAFILIDAEPLERDATGAVVHAKA
jgi:mannose-6-phosphate isomerase-like protein (cupin superfamily)